MQRQAPPQTSSQTQTQTTAPPALASPPQIPEETTLRLRGRHVIDPSELGAEGRGVKWVEGTVDNEGMGRKSSKICCIYHKPRPFDESSSDESSSEEEDDRARPSSSSRGGAVPSGGGGGKGKHAGHRHGRGHGDDCGGKPNALDGGGIKKR